MNIKDNELTVKPCGKYLNEEIYKKAYTDCMKRLKDLANKNEISLKNALILLDNENPQNLKKNTFLFEDFLQIEDMSMQVLIKTVEKKDIVLSLKQTNLSVIEKFLNNMSANAAEMIKEEMEFTGPVRIIDVEEAQAKIIQVMRELIAKGEII